MTYYDAEIEYIQNTDSSCIITDYIPTGPNIKIQGKFTPISYTAAYAPWFRAYTSENADSYRIIRHNTDNNGVYYTCGSKAGGSGSHTVSLNTTYVFEMTRNSLTLNGIVKTFTPTAGTANTGKLTIFCSSRNGSFTRGKLYYFKVYDNDVIIMDLIPVRIGSVGYMYDRVSDTLFGNAGTGSFVLGPDVKVTAPIVGKPKVSSIRRKMLQLMPKTDLKPFDYVQDGLVFHLDGIRKGNKAGYWSDLINGYDFKIIQGMTPKNDGIEFSASDFVSNTWCKHLPATERLSTLYSLATVEVVCSYYNGFGFVWNSNSNSGTCFCFYNNKLGINNLTSANIYAIPDQDLFRTGIHTYSITLDNAYCDTTPFSKSGSTYFSNYTTYGMNIGSRGNGNKYTGIIKSIRIYSRKLTPGEVIRNAIIDNKRFNLGLGSLLPYDTEIEYLESTGTQYIDTNTTYDSDTDSLELEYEYTDRSISGDNMIIGVKGDSNRLTVNTYYSPVLYVGFGNTATRVNLADTSKTYILIKNKKCYSKNANNVLVSVANWSSQDAFTTNIIYLFADNYIDSVKYKHKGIRIKRFKIENKIDLIPVRVGNVGYMYDRISNQLFANAGTGDFILGPDVS